MRFEKWLLSEQQKAHLGKITQIPAKSYKKFQESGNNANNAVTLAFLCHEEVHDI